MPAAAYHDVALTNLDGSGFLRGDFANVVSETGNPAFSATNTFRYTRHRDESEQVMAYYWVTEAQKYIHRLGFGETRRPIDDQPQAVRISQFGQDNSFATGHPKDELRFGASTSPAPPCRTWRTGRSPRHGSSTAPPSPPSSARRSPTGDSLMA